LPISSL